VRKRQLIILQGWTPLAILQESTPFYRNRHHSRKDDQAPVRGADTAGKRRGAVREGEGSEKLDGTGVGLSEEL
jgi:hypothetical protein